MKELNDDELNALHQEAMDLYVTYFRTNAKHKVNVSSSIATEIFSSNYYIADVLYILVILYHFLIPVVLSGPPANVVQLRTTTPLFRAYEEVYNNLESKMCPSFYKSEEVGCLKHQLI